MLHVKNLFYFIFLHFIVATPQINLHYTDWTSGSDNDDNNTQQHDCLHIAAAVEESKSYHQIISYCMSEWPSEFNVNNADLFSKFTFAKLSKQNITSQELFLWSTPIDIIERYQFYLNQLSTTDDLSLGREVFYNCTLPRFGSMCQYEFYYHYSNHSSLYEIIRDFYHTYEYQPTSLTCYTHLQCNRGPFPACLDWTEICDGKVDCLDGGLDEEYCWELEMNECKENEFQCPNGQCIPLSFFENTVNVTDCLDRTVDLKESFDQSDPCKTQEPSFESEDVRCEYTPLTSSCVHKRQSLLLQAMFSVNDNSSSDDCWLAFRCAVALEISDGSICINLCMYDSCIEIIQRICPDMFFIPPAPVLFGDIYLAYIKNNSFFGYPYVCYNNSRYDDYFVNASKLFINNTICYYVSNILPISMLGILNCQQTYLLPFYRDLWEYDQIWKYNQNFSYISRRCNKSDMYQCENSLRCIPRRNLVNTVIDCPHGDDETVADMINIIFEEEHIGIEYWYPEKLKAKLRYIRKYISFQTICDGFVELAPVPIDGRNETDETKCEQWECNNTYTRCDGLWNCPNGADEIGCDLSPPLNCSSNEHICVSPHTNKFMCLPIAKANDGKRDCLGIMDEPTMCRSQWWSEYELYHESNYHCMIGGPGACLVATFLCDGKAHCASRDDEQFCSKNQTTIHDSICLWHNLPSGSDVEKFLCNKMGRQEKQQMIYFSLNGMNKSVENQAKNIEKTMLSDSSIIKTSDKHQPRCHRGLDLRVWVNNENNPTKSTCLCPPSFYGNICQYQNQRVSLTIQFRAPPDSWQIPFAIVILLIDDSDQQIIHSYEQFTYLSVRDCKMKFNIYLLYSTRPKNQTKNYTIHIDIYEKVSLIYRQSLLFPVNFPFLPVHRLVFIVNIPRSNDKNVQSCSNHQCVHGKCIKYSNNPQNPTFCQCEQGWLGRYCNIQHTCQCSNDSLCIGVSTTNRSIYVCPMNKFGSRCLLIDTVCQTGDNSICENNGQCIPNDDYMVSNKKFICICPKGFIGDRCEIVNTQLKLSFGKDIILSQSIFIHFIEVINNGTPVRATTLKTISVGQDSVIIYWSQPFHLVFIEFLNKIYYLAVVQTIYNRSITTIKMINPSDRCPHINEVMNETLAKLHLLRRIKYYHLICQKYSLNLSCFYDGVHLCLCYDYNQKRLANCFEFVHNMTYNCLGQNVCENGGECYQDHPTCPQKSICVCPSCFYGKQCEFSTNRFGLSLDGILGYHILPRISINHQSSIVKVSLALTIVFMVAGFINGILSLITFKNKIPREVGCGVYLLGSSITTLLVTLIFGLKFWILILAQMTVITNRLFLQIQCISLDFLLRVCLNMDQWLNACVAIERAVTTIKGTGFDKKKSKQAAKLVIVILSIFIIGTSAYDPFYRRLIDEEHDENDEKRIWCIITYPSGLQVFNSVMNIFYFFAPFIINLISAIILIIKKSRRESNIQSRRAHKELLREQLQEHKKLFIAPAVLVILALPRLIISFVSKCMKSANDSSLFLVGYFISFIPPMLTFFIFVLPSEFYKKEFRKSLTYYRTNIQRCLHITL